MEVFAQYCHKKIERMAQSGAKKGSKKPTIDEVVHAKVGVVGGCGRLQSNKENFSCVCNPWRACGVFNCLLYE